LRGEYEASSLLADIKLVAVNGVTTLTTIP
jgi:hypothetical protein